MQRMKRTHVWGYKKIRIMFFYAKNHKENTSNISRKIPIPDPLEKETIISDGDILCPDRIPENVRTTIKMIRFISQKTI